MLFEKCLIFANLVVVLHTTNWALWLPLKRDSEDDINDYVDKYSLGGKSWCSAGLA